ncbi:hypothetical protein ACQB6R_06070 [Propionibacteriaceae bacterium G1746]|uniref:hypothetical protein n=1 Tax=Aestuariimicrobium sp. G57 TaxID=3418485 RepID=UPI003C1C0E03
MNFEITRGYPMAYTSREVEWLRTNRGQDAVLAAGWLSGRAGARGAITVVTPRAWSIAELEFEHPALGRLVRSGASLTNARGLGSVSGRWVLLAWPTRDAMHRVLDGKPAGLAVLSWSTRDIEPWVRGCRPERLGPVWTELDDSVPQLHPVVAQAMDSLTSVVNASNGMTGYNRDYTVDALRKLRKAGYELSGRDLEADALGRGWYAVMAHELGEITDRIAAGGRLQVKRDRFRDDIVKVWEQASVATT